MSIPEELDRLRHEMPACRVAAFNDLSSGLVLRVSADQNPRQEMLAEMASTAETALNSALTDAVADTTGAEGPIDTAFVLRPVTSQVFLRGNANTSDGLLIDAPTKTDLLGLAARAREVFNPKPPPAESPAK